MLSIKQNSFIPFVTAGHPDLETTEKIILELASAGSAVIEIGIPFSDPIADGPTIQRSSFSALDHGYRINDYIEMVRRVRAKTDVGLIFMTYLNPIYRYGLEKLDREAFAAGLDGVLISDLTPEEYQQRWVAGELSGGSSLPSGHAGLGDSFKGFQNLKTIFLAAPTSTDERLETICQASTGFVYLVARTGVTGKQTEFNETLPEVVARIRRNTDLPVCVGFGIRSKGDVSRVWRFAEGAIVGSAIVAFIEENKGSEKLPALVAEYVKAQFLP